ncbi:MAG TPA: ATP-binding protein [Desulfobacterales bacterium]|nr:ATP-binding protein [Desulfobacterales bacterium]
MIRRILAKKIEQLAGQYPIVTIIGPRQSGKTTLAQYVFADYQYISFEDPDTRLYVSEDPRGFLKEHCSRIIIDEVQRVPNFLSYLQTHSDQQPETGQFILTGSQHFLLSEQISQSLAGRTAILQLLPLSLEEIDMGNEFPLESYLFRGGYPRLHDKSIAPPDFFPSYIATYLERDIRLIKNIANLASFERFLKLCAGRVGQLVNFSSLADDVGVSHNTVKSWLSLLETSFIIFTLQPHYKKFKKRLVKMPKLYFWDTGLLCSLLGIKSETQISAHFLRGNIFESAIVSEFIKYHYNRGRSNVCYFWRDRHGKEIDCLIERSIDDLLPVEIKSGKTISNDYFKGINYWQKISGNTSKGYVIYGGESKQTRKNSIVLPWQQCLDLFD